jgi:hypothetical protein
MALPARRVPKLIQKFGWLTRYPLFDCKGQIKKTLTPALLGFPMPLNKPTGKVIA